MKTEIKLKNDDYGNNLDNYVELKKDTKKADQGYSYYSRVLKEPFDSIDDLKEAEEAYYAKIAAREAQVAAKKADANEVERAFKCLNAARKAYKQDILNLTDKYSKDLKDLKKSFENSKTAIENILAKAEESYSAALKTFTEKHPEGFHLTLKDGDFETTISSASTETSQKNADLEDFFEIFDGLFRF